MAESASDVPGGVAVRRRRRGRSSPGGARRTPPLGTTHVHMECQNIKDRPAVPFRNTALLVDLLRELLAQFAVRCSQRRTPLEQLEVTLKGFCTEDFSPEILDRVPPDQRVTRVR